METHQRNGAPSGLAASETRPKGSGEMRYDNHDTTPRRPPDPGRTAHKRPRNGLTLRGLGVRQWIKNMIARKRLDVKPTT
jgi:hypothetical protein